MHALPSCKLLTPYPPPLSLSLSLSLSPSHPLTLSPFLSPSLALALALTLSFSAPLPVKHTHMRTHMRTHNTRTHCLQALLTQLPSSRITRLVNEVEHMRRAKREERIQNQEKFKIENMG